MDPFTAKIQFTFANTYVDKIVPEPAQIQFYDCLS